MISFWVTEAGRFCVDTYRHNRGRAIGERFRPVVYEGLAESIALCHGPHIFAALDKLSDPQRRVAAALWDAHARAAPAATRLNDPRRVLTRFDLLRTLHERGINRFKVWRARDVARVDRFPVFVRLESDHGGPRSGLLRSRREIVRALCALRLRGHSLRNLMIVEFCDTASADGWFRKYAAFRVGERIVSCHVMVSREWSVKSDQNRPDRESIREEMAFIEGNPHEAWLRQVFDVAGIGFGRADYGIVDGRPQVWEINLNPTLGRPLGTQRHPLPPPLKALRDRGREAFHERLQAAFVEIDGGGEARESVVRLDPALLAGARAVVARQRRRARLLARLDRLYSHPQLGRPARFAYTRLFPRPRVRDAAEGAAGPRR